MVILSPKLDNEVSKNHPYVGFNLGRFLTDFEFSESFGKKTQWPLPCLQPGPSSLLR